MILNDFATQAVKLEQHKDRVQHALQKQARLAETSMIEEVSVPTKSSWSSVLKGVMQSVRQQGVKQGS